MATSTKFSGWKRTAGQTYISAFNLGIEGIRVTKSSTGCDVRLLGDTPATYYVDFDASAPSLIFAGVGIANSGSVTTGISLAAASTDGIKISGVCTDAIEISSANTYAINISGQQTAGLYYVANMATAGGAYVHGIKVELTRSANVQPATSNWFGAQIVLNAGSTGAWDAVNKPIHVLQAVLKGSKGYSHNDTNVARFETQSDAVVGNMVYIINNSGTTVKSGCSMLYLASHTNVSQAIQINGATNTITDGISFVGTITNAFGFEAASGCGIEAKATALSSLTSAYRIICDINGTPGYIPIMTSWS